MAGFLKQYQSVIYGNYRKAYLLYGLYTGLIMSGYVLFMRIIILPLSAPETYGTDIAMLAAMLLFTYLYRKQLPDGKVFFKELMLLNLGTGVIAAILYGAFLALYGNAFDTEFFSRCTETYINNMTASDKPEAEIQKIVDAYRHYTTFHWSAIGAFRSAVMSIICAFIASLVFRTEQNVVKPRPNRNGL